MAKTRLAVDSVIAEFNSLHDKDKELVVAVSGGVDSSALLFCLSVAKAKIQPVFVYHGIRSEKEESKSWEAALKACHRCNLYNLKTHNEPGTKTLSRKTENDARVMRYKALAMSAGENGVIATAHHADDQLETFIMRLCRGSGIDGLSSIPSSSRIPIQTDINCRVIRPMLRISKSDCIAICKDNAIPWHEDVTNSDNSITRNRIRQEVIPVLRELYPQCAIHASEAAFKLRDISNLIAARVKKLIAQEVNDVPGTIEIIIYRINEEPDAVLSAYFRDVAKRLNGNTRMDCINSRMLLQLVASIKQKKPRHFDWPGLYIEIARSSIRFISVKK